MVRAVLGYSFMVKKKFTLVMARTTFKFIFHGIGTVSYGTSWREGQLDCFSMLMTTLRILLLVNIFFLRGWNDILVLSLEYVSMVKETQFLK